MVAIFWLIPAAIALVVCGIGHAAGLAGRPWPNRRLAILLVLSTLGVAFMTAAMHVPEVPVADAMIGFALAVVGLAALPVLVFYSLGFALRRTWVLGVAWLVTGVPFGFYVLIGWIIVAGYVHCPPDAYECPL